MGAKDVLAGSAQAAGHPWLSSRAELVSLGVTVAALAVLLPLLGVMGAALASVLAYSTALVVLITGAARELGVSRSALLRVERGEIGSMIPARWKGALGRMLCSAPVGRVVALLQGERTRSGECRILATSEVVSPSTRAALFFGLYERAELRFVRSWLRGDLDVVELGSSIGIVSAHLARKLERGQRLVCVEANGALLKLLAENVRTNAPAAELSIRHGAIAYEGPAGGPVALAIAPTNVGSRLAPHGGEQTVEVPSPIEWTISSG
jgi:hypothetical protein